MSLSTQTLVWFTTLYLTLLMAFAVRNQRGFTNPVTRGKPQESIFASSAIILEYLIICLEYPPFIQKAAAVVVVVVLSDLFKKDSLH